MEFAKSIHITGMSPLYFHMQIRCGRLLMGQGGTTSGRQSNIKAKMASVVRNDRDCVVETGLLPMTCGMVGENSEMVDLGRENRL